MTPLAWIEAALATAFLIFCLAGWIDGALAALVVFTAIELMRLM